MKTTPNFKKAGSVAGESKTHNYKIDLFQGKSRASTYRRETKGNGKGEVSTCQQKYEGRKNTGRKEQQS